MVDPAQLGAIPNTSAHSKTVRIRTVIKPVVMINFFAKAFCSTVHRAVIPHGVWLRGIILLISITAIIITAQLTTPTSIPNRFGQRRLANISLLGAGATPLVLAQMMNKILIYAQKILVLVVLESSRWCQSTKHGPVTSAFTHDLGPVTESCSLMFISPSYT